MSHPHKRGSHVHADICLMQSLEEMLGLLLQTSTRLHEEASQSRE